MRSIIPCLLIGDYGMIPQPGAVFCQQAAFVSDPRTSHGCCFGTVRQSLHTACKSAPLKCWCCLQGDLLLIAAGAPAVVHKSLDRVRQYVASSLGEVDTSQHNLSWVTGGYP